MKWLFASAPDRRLLGVAPLSGPTPWVVAIMSFSIVLIAAAGLALANTAGIFARSVEARYSIEVAGAAARQQRLATALEAMPGIANVASVGEVEMRRTLRRWLGPMAESEDLPVPALISFDLAPPARLEEVDALARRIAPGATLSANRGTVGPILDSLRLLQWVAFSLVVLLAAAVSAAIVLAARAVLDTHRATIDILHGIGATDGQLVDLFQRKIALDALAGSLAGAAAAGAILALLAAGAAFLGQLTGGATLGALDLVLLAALPFVLTALATAVGRSAVLASLRSEP